MPVRQFSRSAPTLAAGGQAVTPVHDDAGARRAAWLFDRLQILEGARARRRVIALALALVAPVLACGFSLDDYVLRYQLAELGDEWAGRAPFDLFRWIDPAHNRRLIDGAGLPWWTFPGAICAFMRPVSSFTHTVDHWLWPDSAFAMHLHSVLWFALMLIGAARLYARMFEQRWVAGVASALFALDSAHGTAVGWIANRNALLGGTFGIAALLFHHRARREARRAFVPLAWACFTLSLFSAELSVGVLGYLAAYACFIERAPVLVRARTFAPYALSFGGWAVLRSKLGYGNYGLGAYVDPIGDPFSFGAKLPERALVLLSAQVSRLGSDLHDLVPAGLVPLLLGFWLVALVAVVIFAWPSLRASRPARFFAAGAALSVVPLSATLPNDRLLILTGLGVMGALAQAMHDGLHAFRRSSAAAGAPVTADPVAPQLARSRFRGGMAMLLAAIHLVLDPPLLAWLAISPALVASWADKAEASLPTAAETATQTVIVAQIPDSLLLTYAPVKRALERKPRPNKLFWLAATREPVQFQRRDAHTLRVSSKGGVFDRRSEARSPRHALRAGERVELSGVTVVVVRLTSDHRPEICDFIFDRPLEAQPHVWMTWRKDKLVPFEPPPTGQAKTVPSS